MRGFESCKRPSPASMLPAVWLWLALAGGGSICAAEPRRAPRPWPRIQIVDGVSAFAVRAALDGASRMLADPRCQAVFSDFADQDGRPLREKLAGLGATEQDYLGLVLFRDGSGQKGCNREGVLAFTAQGHSVVYVCGPQFKYGWLRDREWAAAALIHEALHTLGLGENPPSSQAITLRVLKRCS